MLSKFLVAILYVFCMLSRCFLDFFVSVGSFQKTESDLFLFIVVTFFVCITNVNQMDNVTLRAMFRSLITTEGTITVQCPTFVSLIC